MNTDSSKNFAFRKVTSVKPFTPSGKVFVECKVNLDSDIFCFNKKTDLETVKNIKIKTRRCIDFEKCVNKTSMNDYNNEDINKLKENFPKKRGSPTHRGFPS